MYKTQYRLLNNKRTYPGYCIKFDIEKRYFCFNILVNRESLVGKIIKSVIPFKVSDIYDLRSRALLAYDLAKMLRIPVPKTYEIYKEEIKNFNCIYEMYPQLLTDERTLYRTDKILISEYRGRPINKSDYPYVNLKVLWRIFVFNSWIGSLDKKDDEFLIDKGKLWVVDYKFWGVVDGLQTTLGTYAREFPINENTFDMGIGKEIRQLLFSIKKLDFIYSIVESIENLPDQKIKSLVNKYNFFKRGTHDHSINTEMAHYLISRKSVIRKQIEVYIKNNDAENL